MRILFLVIVLANVWVYALGQGWLGPRPVNEGRQTQRLAQTLQADRITLPGRP